MKNLMGSKATLSQYKKDILDINILYDDIVNPSASGKGLHSMVIGMEVQTSPGATVFSVQLRK